MNTTTLPPVFVSHGSPMLAIDPGATGAFFARLGPAMDSAFGRPRAIIAISPHTSARQPIWLAGTPHHAIHDFGGFPAELYTLKYDPPGAPDLARQAHGLLQAAGVQSVLSDEAGLDHGIWAVLRSAWPKADMPVLPLALVPSATPAEQWRLGAALAPLAEQGVLLMGTGSITHNLGRLARGPTMLDDPQTPEDPQCAAFRGWVHERTGARDWAALLDYRRRAPGATAMHPTDEHWLPFYVAAGAGGDQAVPRRLHAGVTYGSLGMDAYAFGPQGDALAQALDEAATVTH